MELQAVACANCGAPLAVPGEARFVTCNHCDSTLEIKHTESVTYSEKIAQIDVRTERIESKLEVMRLERELEACNQEWDRKKTDFAGGDQHSLAVEQALWKAGVLAFLGLGMLLIPGFRFLGVGMVLLACCIGIFGLVKARLYDDAEGHYRGRQFRLASQIEQSRKESLGEGQITKNE